MENNNKKVPVRFTETYDIEIVKKLNGNVVAAIIYNKVLVMYYSNKSKRPDKFCWMKDEQMAEQTGFSRRQILNAFKVLVEAGLVECKKTYIWHTHIACRHFRPIIEDHCEKNEFRGCEKIVQPLNMDKNINKQITTSTLVEAKSPLLDPCKNQPGLELEPASPAAPDASRPEADKTPHLFFGSATRRNTSPDGAQVGSLPVESREGEGKHSGGFAPNGKNTPITSSDSKAALGSPQFLGVVKNTPFSEGMCCSVDLAQKKKAKQAQNAKVAILADSLNKDFYGSKMRKASPALRSVVRARLNEGFTELELRLCVKRAKEHELYSTWTLPGVLKDPNITLNKKAWEKYEEKKAVEDALWY